MKLSLANWNKENYQEYLNYLFSFKDEKYIEFNQKLIFTKYLMIGVRMPVLRKIAKDISKGDIDSFLSLCQYKYYEEVLIVGFILGNIKDLNILEKYLDNFLLKIDDWAICDSFCNSLKIVSLNKEYFWVKIDDFLKRKEEFVVRVGIILLLNFYIDKDYINKILKKIDQIKRDEYYINMAIAWLISECFVKKKEITLKYLKNNNLSKFTQNKAISKIKESYRVNYEDKIMLEKLKKM